MLPNLLVLAPELEQEQGDNAFASFIANRQVVCRLVHLSPWLVRSPQRSLENLLECPVCSKIFARQPERNRHILTHLPQWIHCPLLDCQWMGHRVNLFLNYWRVLHSKYPSDTPTQSQFAICNLDLVYEGIISVDDAEIIARDHVRAKTNQLQR